MGCKVPISTGYIAGFPNKSIVPHQKWMNVPKKIPCQRKFHRLTIDFQGHAVSFRGVSIWFTWLLLRCFLVNQIAWIILSYLGVLWLFSGSIKGKHSWFLPTIKGRNPWQSPKAIAIFSQETQKRVLLLKDFIILSNLFGSSSSSPKSRRPSTPHRQKSAPFASEKTDSVRN